MYRRGFRWPAVLYAPTNEDTCVPFEICGYRALRNRPTEKKDFSLAMRYSVVSSFFLPFIAGNKHSFPPQFPLFFCSHYVSDGFLHTLTHRLLLIFFASEQRTHRQGSNCRPATARRGDCGDRGQLIYLCFRTYLK